MITKPKFLYCLGAIAALASMMNILSADQFGDFTYTDNGSSITITAYPTSAAGAAEIPASILGKPVTSIGSSAFRYCSGLTSIMIPNTIISIDSYAFSNCTGLTTLGIPGSVTSIGSSVFYYCTSLTDVTISSGVTSIGYAAFQMCRSLASVTIPSSVTTIGSSAFTFCLSLTTITVDPFNLAYSSVDGVLFDKNNTALIQYPGGKSGTYTIPSSVRSIKGSAFSHCHSLTSVTVPSGVTQIYYEAGGSSVFAACAKLTEITVNPQNPSFSSVDGILFNKSKTRLIQFPSCKSGIATIPSSVSNIDTYAFFYCVNLTAIMVNSLNSAYSSVDGVLFNKGQTTLLKCPGGKSGSVAIPDSVTNIDIDGFSYCKALQSVTIPRSVTTIGFVQGGHAFSDCSSLSAIAVHPLNPSYSGIDGILYNKSKTKLIQFPGGKSGNVIIPSSVTTIGNSAFSGCSSLTSVTIPGSVTKIEDGAFNCSNLKSAFFWVTHRQ